MREIVNIHIGQCGNQIGAKFWEIISCEHGINNQGLFCGESAHQLERIAVYYNEGFENKYTPRAILIDLEPGIIDSIRGRDYGSLFRPDNFVYGINGAGNNWAKGHYTEGLDLSFTIMEITRKEAEDCECLQGFQIVHSLGGGTGSGLGSLLVSKLREEYPDKIMSTHSIIPSPKVSDIVVEPYNTILSLHHLVENADETFVMDNEALYQICYKKLKTKLPLFSDINHIICNTMSGITACFRFPGQINTDLRKLAVNVVPFPRLHFLVPAFAPIHTNQESNFCTFTISEIVRQLYNMDNLMAAIDTRSGRYLALAGVFRGKVSSKNVEEHMVQVRNKNWSYFADWIPNSIKIGICDIAGHGYRRSATLLCNTTAIQELFSRIESQFSTMYQKRAYLHWYLSESMEEEEFEMSQENLQELMNEYAQYQEASGDDDLQEFDELGGDEWEETVHIK